MSAKGFLEYDSFLLEANIYIIKAPPYILFPVVDEGIVVATLCCAIVNQDSMQVVGNIPIVTKRGPYLILFLLNLLRYRSHFTLNGMPVGRQYIRCVD